MCISIYMVVEKFIKITKRGSSNRFANNTSEQDLKRFTLRILRRTSIMDRSASSDRYNRIYVR